MGQIAGLAQESSGESQTQFQKEVAIFIKYISILAITIGALLQKAQHRAASHRTAML